MRGILSNNTLISIYLIFGVVLAIIVISSVFVIRNSFAISITEKNRQYGMLRSIGATKKQIKELFFMRLNLGYYWDNPRDYNWSFNS